jgi:putative (di)nucleoside polyphosphate hydrolase
MSEVLGYRRGVGIMLLNNAARVFVGRRIDTPGAWQMPQGGIDDGETPQQAVLRELEEEVGTRKAEIVAEAKNWLRYDLPEPLQGRAWGGGYRGQEQKWFALKFLGDDGDIKLDRHEPEFEAWRWAARGELLTLIVPFKRKLYESVIAELAGVFEA